MYCNKGPQFVKCVVLEKQSGLYSHLVIEDLNTHKYLILTVFPNWQGEIPNIGETGHIEFEYAEAGITKFYNKVEKNMDGVYQNTYFVFKKFIKETINKNKDILI